MIQHRIVERLHYDQYRELRETWFEVQVLKKFLFWSWWSSECEAHFSTGGSFDTPIKFKNVPQATEYVARLVKNIPKQTVITKEVTSFIS